MVVIWYVPTSLSVMPWTLDFGQFSSYHTSQVLLNRLNIHTYVRFELYHYAVLASSLSICWLIG